MDKTHESRCTSKHCVLLVVFQYNILYNKKNEIKCNLNFYAKPVNQFLSKSSFSIFKILAK